MPFVENAFKHVSRDADHVNWIKIDSQVENDWLTFSVSNSASTDKVKDLIHDSGIGLDHVKRRLALLYPGTSDLLISKSDNRFDIVLKIQLTTAPAGYIAQTQNVLA